MKVLIIGAGMYVTGRDGTGVGTILSSLAETSRLLPIEEVTVVARDPHNSDVVVEAVARINATIRTDLKVIYRQITGDAAVDIPELCDQCRYDCAIVSIPDHLHFSYTAQLMKSGVHCLVVKPLTPTLAEAQELVRLQNQYKVYGAVEFHKRFDATNLYIKKILTEEKLGKLLYFTVDYSQKITIPSVTFAAWSHATNIFQYLGVHYVDLIYFLTGYRPERVMALGTDGILRRQGIDTFDSVHATIVWRGPDSGDRCVSQFATNWIDPACTSAMSDQKYKVIGTSGRIECDQKNRGVEFVHEQQGILQVNPYFSEYLPDENGNLCFSGYGHTSINLFLRDVLALQKGAISCSALENIRPTFRESLVSAAVVDAVNRSLALNASWIDIDATS